MQVSLDFYFIFTSSDETFLFHNVTDLLDGPQDNNLVCANVIHNALTLTRRSPVIHTTISPSPILFLSLFIIYYRYINYQDLGLSTIWLMNLENRVLVIIHLTQCHIMEVKGVINNGSSHPHKITMWDHHSSSSNFNCPRDNYSMPLMHLAHQSNHLHL